MNSQRTILTLLLLHIIPNSETFNYNLILDYLQWKNLNVILYVTCERRYWIDIYKTMDNLQSDSIWINQYDISTEYDVSNFNYERSFIRLGYPYLVVVNLECNYTETFLTEISNRKMFHFERHWLMIGKSVDQMFNVLSKQNINVDAEIVTATVQEREILLDDVYNPTFARHSRFRMQNIGIWNERHGLTFYDTQTKFEKRRNFGGITLSSAITIPKIPTNFTFMEHINSDENPHLDSMSKNNYRVVQLLMQMYNFKMNIRRTKIWGYLQPDGYWQGAVGLINRSEVDICISGLRWEDERYGAFDQTTNAFYVQILFIFRHPKEIDVSNVYLTPFDLKVWILIVALGIAVSLAAMQFFTHENYQTNECSFSQCSLMVFGIFFQQGYSGTPSFLSTRILTWEILVFSVCMYQFYGSFIVGSLLTEAPKTIKTVKQLLNSGLEVGVDEVPYILDNFKRVREESALKLYNKVMAQPNSFMPLYRGLNLVKKGSFAFHTDGSYAFTILKSMLTDREACDLQEVKYVPKIPTGLGVPKKSPLKEMVKIGIRKVYETGILSYQWKIWIGHLPQCENSKVDVIPVDLPHFSSALYLLGFGIQISIFILVAELIIVHFIKMLDETRGQDMSRGFVH